MVSVFQVLFDIVTILTLLWVGYHFGVFVDIIGSNIAKSNGNVDNKSFVNETIACTKFPEQSILSEPTKKEKVQLVCEYVQKPNKTITHKLKVFGFTVLSYKKKVKVIPQIRTPQIEKEKDDSDDGENDYISMISSTAKFGGFMSKVK